MRTMIIIFGVAVSGSAAVAMWPGSPAQLVRPEPGQWEFDPRIERIDATGLPSGTSTEEMGKTLFADQLRIDRQTCLSAEQAASADDPGELRIAGFRKDQCTVSSANRSGGTLDVAGTCRDDRGLERTFSITGKLEPDSIDITMEFDDRVPQAGARIQSVLRLEGRRTGPCEEEQGKPWYGRSHAEARDPSEASNALATEAATDVLP